MIRTFKDIQNKTLVINTRRHAIILSRPIEENGKMHFPDETFEDLIIFLQDESQKCWDNFNPKEANSFSSDYYEYYDKQFDNNGYISIDEHSLNIERPVEGKERCYQFNKAKMQSFMFDLLNGVGD